MLTAAQTSTAPIEITVTDHGKPISPDLFGIFFEDLSPAVDGGLYAELVQNRSFDAKGRLGYEIQLIALSHLRVEGDCRLTHVSARRR